MKKGRWLVVFVVSLYISFFVIAFRTAFTESSPESSCDLAYAAEFQTVAWSPGPGSKGD